MNLSHKVWTVVLGVWIVGVAMGDETLGDKKKWAAQDEYMKEHVAGVKEKCGKEIPYKFDKDSFKKMGEQYSPNGVCQNVYNFMYSLCQDPMSKEALMKKVTKVTCKYNPKRGLAFSGSELVWNGNNEEANVDDFFKKWFDDHL